MNPEEENSGRHGSRIPSGIRSIDHASDGGLPSGSYVILFGKSGSGKEAFMQTAALMNSAMKENMLSFDGGKKVFLPDKIWYLVFAKTKDDVLRDIEISYSDELVEAFKNVTQFKEFMQDYYASTMAPLWEGEESAEEKEGADKIEIIRNMVNFLDKEGKNSLIILDSLDDLIRAFPSGEEDRLLTALRSVQSRNKSNWNSLFLNRLSQGVFPDSVEESIFSLSDGVFEFKTMSSRGRKKRNLSCRKFTGAPSSLLDSSFEYQVTDSGFEARRTEYLES